MSPTVAFDPGSASGAPGQLATSFVLGVVLGTIFFGMLWWTVRRGLTARNPGLWFGLSALGRMGSAFAGLYFLARGGGPAAVLACLLGLLVARVAVTHLVRRVA